jgi:hypothetical protein
MKKKRREGPTPRLRGQRPLLRNRKLKIKRRGGRRKRIPKVSLYAGGC